MDSPFEPAKAYSGRYEISDAQLADGTKYHGKLLISPQGYFAHAAVETSIAGERHGLAVVFHNRLLIAWGPKDKVEIGAYRITGERMSGIWVPPGATGESLAICGRENSRLISPGEWEIEEARAIDQQPYTGRVRVSEPPESTPPKHQPVSVQWKLHDGDYESFALKLNDLMVATFSFQPELPHGIAVYDATPAGWEGTQLWNDGGLVREQLRRA